ncbi:hypothetical protein BB559_001141 [Furculomyces boomerangus]|uniref:Methyltransferase domain-containing protein n=1 Tax=Furculomyces boomerangus TaxID=61424 RepID=A0A2T9Z2Z0_9FUNG|nr:hypothetical protein BB559_001141 [Furculomyces boomerangus]
MQSASLIVDKSFAKIKLRTFVLQNFRTQLPSRSDVSQAFKTKNVSVNGELLPENYLLNPDDIVTVKSNEITKIKKLLSSKGVKLVWSSKIVQNTESKIDFPEYNQLLALWKPAGVSINEIQSSAWAFSEIYNNTKFTSNTTDIQKIKEKGLHHSEDPIEMELQPEKKIKLDSDEIPHAKTPNTNHHSMQDFIKNTLLKRARMGINGFTVVNEVGKAAYGLVLVVHGTDFVNLIQKSIDNGDIEFGFVYVCHGDFSNYQKNSEKTVFNDSKDNQSVIDSRTGTDRWVTLTGLDKNCFEYLDFETKKVGDSLVSGKLSLVEARVKRSCVGGLLLRRFMLDINYPIVGCSIFTKPLRNSSDKGLLLSLNKITLKNFYEDQNDLLIEHELPSKFESVVNREQRFFETKMNNIKTEYFENGGSIKNNNEDSNFFDAVDVLNDVPLAYQTNLKEFCGIPFYVTSDTLIPRKSTETLVQAAGECINLIEKQKNSFVNNQRGVSIQKPSCYKVIDLGTGSGAIIVSILHKNKDREIVGVGIDLSQNVLDIARENAIRNGLSNKIEFFCESFEGVGSNTDICQRGPFSLIVSNPPYISPYKAKYLNPSTKNYEPGLALYADDDGYQFYKQIQKSLEQSSTNCNGLTDENSILILEVGKDMINGVREIFGGWNEVGFWRDPQGHPRCIAFSKSKLYKIMQ